MSNQAKSSHAQRCDWSKSVPDKRWAEMARNMFQLSEDDIQLSGLEKRMRPAECKQVHPIVRRVSDIPIAA